MTTKTEEPLVACIILNWNGMIIKHEGTPILKKCLATLVKTKYSNMRILVVDADSEDDSVQYVKKNFKNVDILKVPNKGWPYGNNRGMKHAYSKHPSLKYVALLNDDLDFGSDRYWLKKLVDAAERNDKIGIVTCRTLHPDGRVDYSGMHLSPSGLGKADNNRKNHSIGVIGALMLFKKELLKKIGLFDEIYLPLYGGDDTDFVERTKRAGYDAYYINSTKIYHVGGASSVGGYKFKNAFSRKEVAYSRVRGTYILLLRYHPLLLISNLIYSLGWVFVERKQGLKFRPLNEIRMLLPMPLKGLVDAGSMYKIKKIPYMKR